MAEIAERISCWGTQELDGLVDAVEAASTANEKGRSLEQLCSRLFKSVPGFTIKGHRFRTKTEEIDIEILNDSPNPILRREAAIILVECKNWTESCGKDEFVLFKEKIANRGYRSTLGFLVSWNGFADTITKEMLRGSREEVLIVPMSGKDIRSGVGDGGFDRVLLDCWHRAVNT